MFLLAILGSSLMVNAILFGRMRYPVKLGFSSNGIWYITLSGVLTGEKRLIPWENIKSIKPLKLRKGVLYELFFRSKRGFPLTLPVSKDVAPMVEKKLNSYLELKKREQ